MNNTTGSNSPDVITPAPASVTAAASEAPYPSPAYGWYVVIILYLCYTFSFVDRAIITFLADPIRKDLLIGDTGFSILSGLSFVVFYAFMGIPVGRLADSGSRRNLLLAGIAVWSSMTVLCGIASTFWELFFFRMGVGLGEAVLVPCAYSLISDYFPREKRGLPLTFLSAAIMLGAGVANICGGMVAQFARSGGPREIFLFGHVVPWQLSFILVGLPGIFFIIAVATIKEPIRHEQRGKPNTPLMFRYLFRHWKTYSSLIGGMTFGALTNGAILGWAVIWLMRRFAWEEAQSGLYLGSIIILFGTVGLSLAGSLANKFISAGKKAVYINLMIAAESLVIIPLILAHIIDNPYWVLGCMGGVIFFGGVSGGLGPASLQTITPNEMRGQITAIGFLVLNLVAITLGMTSVGLLTDYVFKDINDVRSSAVIVGILGSILGIISLQLGRRAYEHTAEESKAAPSVK